MMLHSRAQAKENLKTQEMNRNFHSPYLSPNQCNSTLVQTINAPIDLVWSIIKKFDNPQAYKGFIKSCTILASNGGVGSIREVELISGLPAKTSTERLDILDEDMCLMTVSIIGGDHRLANYVSTITLHEIKEEKGSNKTFVIESYFVDIPSDSCKEDTCLFADTIIGCNLKSLAKIAEKMAA